MRVVSVTTDPAVSPGTPERLFDIAGFTLTNTRSFDIARNGQRFLMLKTAGAKLRASRQLRLKSPNVLHQERRARQAQAIHRWRPWEHSTGPRTAEGKARSARNAYAGGHWRFRSESCARP